MSRNITAYRSDRVVLTIKRIEVRYKLLQIVFAKDGGFFVTCPYFRHRTGLLSRATIPANGQRQSVVDLEPGGRVASHLVKYTHHPDGEAHFSGDGKIFTTIRRVGRAARPTRTRLHSRRSGPRRLRSSGQCSR